MDGRRHGRGGGGVGDAGGCRARAHRHVRGAGEDGWDTLCKGLLWNSGAAARAACGWLQFLRGRQPRASPPSTHYGEPPLCATPHRRRGSGCPRLPWICRRHIVSVLTCEEIFAEAHACTDAELYCRELRWTTPCCQSC